MQIGFAEIPPKGLSLDINGQRFDLVGIEDYTKADGTASNLLIWQAECSTCGQGFLSKSSAFRLPDVKRCDIHRQPGKPVRKI